jgi:hypothetical protein
MIQRRSRIGTAAPGLGLRLEREEARFAPWQPMPRPSSAPRLG